MNNPSATSPLAQRGVLVLLALGVAWAVGLGTLSGLVDGSRRGLAAALAHLCNDRARWRSQLSLARDALPRSFDRGSAAWSEAQIREISAPLSSAATVAA